VHIRSMRGPFNIYTSHFVEILHINYHSVTNNASFFFALLQLSQQVKKLNYWSACKMRVTISLLPSLFIFSLKQITIDAFLYYYINAFCILYKLLFAGGSCWVSSRAKSMLRRISSGLGNVYLRWVNASCSHASMNSMLYAFNSLQVLVDLG
jgi:hypothetical protein